MPSAPKVERMSIRSARRSDLPRGFSAALSLFATSRPLREAGGRAQGDIVGNEIGDDRREGNVRLHLAAAGRRGRGKIAGWEVETPSTRGGVGLDLARRGTSADGPVDRGK